MVPDLFVCIHVVLVFYIMCVRFFQKDGDPKQAMVVELEKLLSLEDDERDLVRLMTDGVVHWRSVCSDIVAFLEQPCNY